MRINLPHRSASMGAWTTNASSIGRRLGA